MINESDENVLLMDSKFIAQKKYWLEKLQGNIEETKIYYYTCNVDEPGKMGKIRLLFSPDLVGKIMKLSNRMDLAIYIVLLAGLKVLIYRCTSNKNIAVISPIYKINETGETINDFLLINDNINNDLTFKDLLHKIRKSVLDAYQNQDYPFEKLIRYLHDTSTIKKQNNNKFISNIICSMENIHNDINFKERKINGKIFFSFLREEDKIGGVIQYDSRTYEKKSVKQIAGHFINILKEGLRQIDIEISKIFFLSEQEKKRLLFDFNNTRRDYPGDKTIYELFARQVKKTPHRMAVVFENQQLTYGALDEKTTRLAHQLVIKGVKPNTIIGILMETSLEAIVGILGILEAGGAYLPLDRHMPHRRLMFILEDCRVPILLTTGSTIREATPGAHRQPHRPKMNYHSEKVLRNIPGIAIAPPKGKSHKDKFTGRIIIDIDMAISGGKTGKKPGNFNKSTDIAYIMFTSGSTGKPKGVIVEQKNVIRLVKNTNFIRFHREDRILQTSALEFDASTFEIWGALLNGLSLWLSAREKILDPKTLKEGIRKGKIRTMWLTAPLFNRIARLDVSIFAGLSNLLVGGDVLNPDPINKVKVNFPGLHIINGYGPTENTTFSTTFLITGEHKNNIPIGKPIANSSAYIVDRCDNLLPVGVPGELLLGGDGISRGYLNNPELTKKKFIKNPFKPGEKLYRSGDIAMWLPGGVIEFQGRTDHQVKIRGFRVELEEIGNQLLKYDGIKEAIVTSNNPANDDNYLTAYIVPGTPAQFNDKKSLAITGLKEFLSRELPHYMIPSFIVPLEKIPLTPRGKVDRNSLPQPGSTVGPGYIAPRDEVEKKLAAIWSEVLKVREETIGIEDDFFELGGHSLNAIKVIANIHKELNVTVPLVEFFSSSCIMELAGYIKEVGENKYISIAPVEEKEYYPLSPAQKRMYFLQKMTFDNTNYNIIQAYMLVGELHQEKLTDTFKQLINRHESLRTSFEIAGDKPVQRVHKEVEFTIRHSHTSTGFKRPFDLSLAPLLRVGLIKSAKLKHLLIIDMHHIISDGVSQSILVKDFIAIYRGRQLPPLKLQYKDYSQWQNNPGQKELIKQQQRYWLKLFEGEIPVLNLPTDYPRPEFQSFAGDRMNFQPGRKESNALKELAINQKTTLHVVLASIFNVLLSRITGQEDIIIGTPAVGRRHADLEQIIGIFVNTLALRNYTGTDKKFSEFLQNVKENTLMAFENQDYPFEELVDQLSQIIERDTSRNPLFDIMFGVQNQELPTGGIPGLKIFPHQFERKVSLFDLRLQAVEARGKLLFTFEYCTKLFKKDTIRRFCAYYKKLVSSVLEDPGKSIAEMEIIPGEERKQLLLDFNHTEAKYPENKTLHQLFAEQVNRAPDHTALQGGKEEENKQETPCSELHLSYGELHEKANRLACLLKEKSIRADTVIAVTIKRTIETFIGILGILKSGAAYLPIDPGDTEERTRYMLADSGAKPLVTYNDTASRLSSSPLPDSPASTPANLAYVTYIPTSTGKPKGVAISHRSIINHLHWIQKTYPIDRNDVILHRSPFTPDIPGWELSWWSLHGAMVSLSGAGDRKNPTALKDTVERNHVTILHLLPTMLQDLLMYLQETASGDSTIMSGLKQVFVSGEELTVSQVEMFNKLLYEKNNTRLIILYGTTETAMLVSYFNCSARGALEKVCMGKPIDNIRLMVVDSHLRLQPIGIAGELCIGGMGLARGYLNHPQLTAEKFITTPDLSPMDKIYRTGDRVRWLPGGNLEYLGRIDRQVKINGKRLELEEMETCLEREPGVKDCAVVVRQKKEKQVKSNYLCVYLVADEEIDLLELKKRLLTKIPTDIAPTRYIVVDNLHNTGIKGTALDEAHWLEFEKMHKKKELIVKEITVAGDKSKSEARFIDEDFDL